MDKKINPELIEILRNYNENQIYLLLNNKKYISPDIIYILYTYNHDNLFKGVVKYIQRILSLNDMYKRWIMELNNNDDITEIRTYIKDMSYTLAQEMFSTNGAIYELALIGKNKFKLSTDSTIDNVLKNHLYINEDGIEVPICPIDKSLGKIFPLFEIKKDENNNFISEYDIINGESISNNKSVKFENRIDEDGRCLSIYPIKYKEIDVHEIHELEESIDNNYQLKNPIISSIFIGKIKDEDDIYYVADSGFHYLVQINNKELEAIKSKKLGFYIDKSDGTLYLRCTFINKIPSLSSFISYKGILKGMSKKIENYRKSLQTFIDNRILKEFEELKKKKETRKLLPQEQVRYNNLKRFIDKKESEKIHIVKNITETHSDDESPQKDLFEQYSYEEYESSKDDVLQDINIEKILKENYDHDELELIYKIDKNQETRNIIKNAIKHINIHYKINDKKKKKDWDYTYINISDSLLSSIATILIKNNKATVKTINECTVCGNAQDEDVCNYCKNLANKLFDMYVKYDNYMDFYNNVKHLEKNTIIHIEKSNVLDVIELMYDGQEIINEYNKFIKNINKNLYLSKQKILYGYTMITTNVVDIDNAEVNDLKAKLKDILDKASSTYVDLDIEDVDITLLDILSAYFE